MAYIGRDTDKISNVEVLDNITFDGSSSYTLQKGGVNFNPSSANNILLSIDGVVQANNFSVSSSTIDFGTAVAGTSTCDFILHYGVGLITTPSDGTVTTAKLADSSVSLAKLTATGTKDATTFLRGDNTFNAPPLGGITEADQWRFSTGGSFVNDAQITSGWERVDTDGFNYIGTGITESSGTFSFPSTGIYLIIGVLNAYEGSAVSYAGHFIKTTTDNSSYNAATDAFAGIYTGYSWSSTTTSFIFDVTNVSTHKVRLHVATPSGSTSVAVAGSTSSVVTGLTFIRLGDT